MLWVIIAVASLIYSQNNNITVNKKDRGLRSWAEAATAAKDRTTWKERACGPIPGLGKRGN